MGLNRLSKCRLAIEWIKEGARKRGQNELIGIFVDFLLILLYFGIFVLIYLLLMYFSFYVCVCCFFLKKEKTIKLDGNDMIKKGKWQVM